VKIEEKARFQLGRVVVAADQKVEYEHAFAAFAA